jgi:hypothetical protein
MVDASTPKPDVLRPPEFAQPVLSDLLIPFEVPVESYAPGRYRAVEDQRTGISESRFMTAVMVCVGVGILLCGLGILSSLSSIRRPLSSRDLAVLLKVALAVPLSFGIAGFFWWTTRKRVGQIRVLGFDFGRRTVVDALVARSGRTAHQREYPLDSVTVRIHEVEFVDQRPLRAYAACAHVGEFVFALACRWTREEVARYVEQLPKPVRALCVDDGPLLRAYGNIAASAAAQGLWARAARQWRSRGTK